MKKFIDNYFQESRSWFSDIYIEAIASRNRYRFAFLWSLLIISLFLVGFILIIPLQHYQIIVVHHSDDGTVWIDQPKNKKFTIDHLQIESDIVRYITNRESYNTLDYHDHYSLINLLSASKVARAYQQQQSTNNSDSPINRFKNEITRTVQVQNVIYLNKSLKHPLAQVNFIVTDRDQVTGHSKKTPLLAIISWCYRGIPKDPRSQWLNWDGFTVTHYSIQQRNL